MSEHNTKPAEKTRRMRITIAFQAEYDAPESMYEDSDPKKMATADEEEASKAPFLALRGLVDLPGGRFRVQVKPVVTEAEKAGLEVKE